MKQVIIYKQDNGIPAVIHPSEEALFLYGVDAIAKKDVPAGKPYKIMPLSAVPADRVSRNQWKINDANLTDGVGDVSNEFPKGN